MPTERERTYMEGNFFLSFIVRSASSETVENYQPNLHPHTDVHVPHTERDSVYTHIYRAARLLSSLFELCSNIARLHCSNWTSSFFHSKIFLTEVSSSRLVPCCFSLYTYCIYIRLPPFTERARNNAYLSTQAHKQSFPFKERERERRHT